MNTRPIFLALLGVAPLSAALIHGGSNGTAFFGASLYSCPAAPDPCSTAPQFGANNISGRFDALKTPGNGWRIADPNFGNHIEMTPNGGMGLGGTSRPTPYTFTRTGGISGDGSSFGSGSLTVSGGAAGLGVGSAPGARMAFSLTDSSLGGGSASYILSSIESLYTVDGLGFAGTIGTGIGILGNNPTASDGAVVSMAAGYQINGGAFVALPDLILAFSGACTNDVTIGTSTAALNGACAAHAGGIFQAAGTSVSSALSLTAGDTLRVVTTLTVYADPAFITSIDPDINILNSLTLPDFLATAVASAETPEPATWLALGGGLLALGLARRSTSRSR